MADDSGAPSGKRFNLGFRFWSTAGPCTVTVYLGHMLLITGRPLTDKDYDPADPLALHFVAVKGTPFDELPSPAYSFLGDSEREQTYDKLLTQIDLSLYQWKGTDYTRAMGSYYPLLIHLKSETYETVYYLEFQPPGPSSSPPTVRLLK